MTTEIKVKDIADTDVDHTKEALVASLEFTLVEDLDGNYGGIFNGAKWRFNTNSRSQGTKKNVHIKIFIPVWIQCLFDDTCRMCLLCIYSDDGEGVGKSKHITLREAISSNDYHIVNTLQKRTKNARSPVILIFLVLCCALNNDNTTTE